MNNLSRQGFKELLLRRVDSKLLNREQADALLGWYNVADGHFCTDDVKVLAEHIETRVLTFDECESNACGDIFINTTNFDSHHWVQYQGVAYEGGQVNPYIEGHFEGNQPTPINACTECGLTNNF